MCEDGLIGVELACDYLPFTCSSNSVRSLTVMEVMAQHL